MCLVRKLVRWSTQIARVAISFVSSIWLYLFGNKYWTTILSSLYEPSVQNPYTYYQPISLLKNKADSSCFFSPTPIWLLWDLCRGQIKVFLSFYLGEFHSSINIQVSQMFRYLPSESFSFFYDHIPSLVDSIALIKQWC